MKKNLKIWRNFFSRLINQARAEFDLARIELENCGGNTRVGGGCQFIGAHAIFVGQDCVIGEHSWLNTNSNDSSISRIEIGDCSLIGRRNFLSSGKSIRLGSYTLTGPDCHLVCADHKISDPCIPYVSSGATLDASIFLGANCWLGTSVIVLGQVTIGCGSVVGSGAVVLKDLPPFSLAVGNPARVLKRFDFLEKNWVPVDEWTDEMEAALPSEDEYLAILRARKPHILLPKIAAGAGIDRP